MAFQVTSAVFDAFGGAGGQAVDASQNAARVSLRPLEHGVLGHYRGAAVTGAMNTLTAGQILSSFTWLPSGTMYAVIERISITWEVLAKITTTTPVDFRAYVFRGATGKSAGTGSSLTVPSPMNKKHALSQLNAAAGEWRIVGTTTALTAATGKTNDANPFAVTQLAAVTSVNATGTAVAGDIGTAASADMYKYDCLSQYPLVLSPGEGIEWQVITANGAQNQQVAIIMDWAEVAFYAN